ncbi:MAG: AmmeMemoRadiSam system radical SAM enzyme [Syntrophales bacterium]
MKKEAMFYEEYKEGVLHCFLCNHHCKISEGKFGFCGVRRHEEGKLYTYAYGNIIASHIDPIEKKPLYHFLPGSRSFSIATIGCNFRCGFCQNWQISQLSIKKGNFAGQETKPEDIVRGALANGCKSISYTYTEPTIFFEYAYDISRLAKKDGLFNVFVTNGFMTKEALETIHPILDAANCDLKSFRDNFYKKVCSGRLQPVLDSIRLMKKLGIWVEVTTLIIPGENDSEEELNDIAAFIAETGKEIPWHISRFHPDYKFDAREPTSLGVLRKAKAIGEKHGLRYVYMGNVNEESDTYCYNCHALLAKRTYFTVQESHVKEGKCEFCAAPVEGRW